MKERNLDRKKILGISLLSIGILLALVGIIIGLVSNKQEGASNKPSDGDVVDKEKLANSILEELNIDDYLRFIFRPGMNVDEDLLALDSGQNMVMYFYSNDNLHKYKMHFAGDSVTRAYVKYDDYVNEHKKIFGVPPVYDVTSVTLKFPTVTDDINEAKYEEIGKCDFSNTSDCYLLLTDFYTNTNTIEFSKLNINNNVISGNVKMIVKDDNLERYLDGTFEFEYEKSKGNYIAKGLKIKSVADAFNA